MRIGSDIICARCAVLAGAFLACLAGPPAAAQAPSLEAIYDERLGVYRSNTT